MITDAELERHIQKAFEYLADFGFVRRRNRSDGRAFTVTYERPRIGIDVSWDRVEDEPIIFIRDRTSGLPPFLQEKHGLDLLLHGGPDRRTLVGGEGPPQPRIAAAAALLRDTQPDLLRGSVASLQRGRAITDSIYGRRLIDRIAPWRLVSGLRRR